MTLFWPTRSTRPQQPLQGISTVTSPPFFRDTLELLAVSGNLLFRPFPGELLKFFYVLFVDTHGFGYFDHDNILSAKCIALAITIFSALRSALPRPKVCGLRPPVGVKEVVGGSEAEAKGRQKRKNL
jgi:hypothetical protein